jgi:pyroglutamyl-peptidase
VRQTRPDVILALGQAAGAAAVRLEDRAANIDDFPIPDNAGNLRRWQLIARDGPLAYLATFPRRRIGRALQQAGIPVEHSFSAGSYVCNHLYYGLLHRTELARESHQIGFIHLPVLPEQVPAGQKWPSLPREVLAEGVRRAIAVCAAG